MDPQDCKKKDFFKKERWKGAGEAEKTCRFYLIGILNMREGYADLRISSPVISIPNDGHHV